MGRNNGSGWKSGWSEHKLAWEGTALAAPAGHASSTGRLRFLPDAKEWTTRELATRIDDGTVWIALLAQARFEGEQRKGDKNQWTSLYLTCDGEPALSLGCTRKDGTVAWHGIPRRDGKIIEAMRDSVPLADPGRPGLLVARLDLQRQQSDLTLWADPPPGREPDPAAGQRQSGIPFTAFNGLRFSGSGGELSLGSLRIGRTWREVIPPP